MCNTHSTTAEPNAELCDEVSQDHSWCIFARGEEEHSNLQVGQAAKGMRELMRKRLCFLGHLERMKDERVPKKLLCVPKNMANELPEASISDAVM